MESFGIFAIVVVVFALVLIRSAVKVVPQGMEYTLETFGKFTGILKPGLHLIFPFTQGIGARVDMRERVLDVPKQEVITRDNAMITVDGVVFYQVLDAARASYEVQNLAWAILNLVMTNLRTVMGSMDLDELLSQRDRINVQLLSVVDHATTAWGVKVTRIEIKDITPPRDLVESMGRQMKAERDKRAAVLEAEGLRQAAILRAEGEKQATILQAEGRREGAFREAEARERQAAAEARATELVSTAIAQGSALAVNYFVAQKYVEALRAIASAPNQKLVLMPIEATGILGSLAGIADIAREALGRAPGGSAAPSAPPPPPRPAGPWSAPGA